MRWTRWSHLPVEMSRGGGACSVSPEPAVASLDPRQSERGGRHAPRPNRYHRIIIVITSSNLLAKEQVSVDGGRGGTLTSVVAKISVGTSL